MIILTKLLPVFAFPLGFAILLMTLSLVFFILNRRRAGLFFLILPLLMLLVLSNSVVSNLLIRSQETRYLPIVPGSKKGDWIIVLGGAGRPASWPRAHVELNEGADRILEGLRQYKAGAAPRMMTTGGGIDFILKGQKEGQDLKTALVELGVPEGAITTQTLSRNTYEDAKFALDIIKDKKTGKRIILVTSALHMVRSVPIFKKAGFDVVPAPCDYVSDDQPVNWYNLLPSAGSLMLSTQAVKEGIGRIAYRAMGWL